MAFWCNKKGLVGSQRRIAGRSDQGPLISSILDSTLSLSRISRVCVCVAAVLSPTLVTHSCRALPKLFSASSTILHFPQFLTFFLK